MCECASCTADYEAERYWHRIEALARHAPTRRPGSRVEPQRWARLDPHGTGNLLALTAAEVRLYDWGEEREEEAREFETMDHWLMHTPFAAVNEGDDLF